MSGFSDNDDLEFEYDLTHNKEAADFAIKPIPPGKYHAQVEGLARGQAGDSPCLKMALRLRTGPMANRVHTESIFLTDKNIDRQKLIAYRLGLFDPAQLGKPGAKAKWSRAIGRHVVIEIEENKFTNKSGVEQIGSRVAFSGVWAIDAPEVRDVPKDMVALADDGIVLPELPPGSPPPGDQPPPPPKSDAYDV